MLEARPIGTRHWCGASWDYMIRQAGTGLEMPVSKNLLPTPANPYDRYEIERLLEARMDAHFGEHLAVHIVWIEPVLDVVFGFNVEGRPDWWKGRHGG